MKMVICALILLSSLGLHAQSDYYYDYEIDSDQYYGIRDPDGYTRERFSCSDGFTIFVTSVKFGFQVLIYTWSNNNCKCLG